MTETLDYDLKRKSSRPSPEEGHRSVRLFLSVERADLREEICNFVEEILRRQDRGYSIERPRAASLWQIGSRWRRASAEQPSSRGSLAGRP
jgi:hypothetical protein